MYVVDVEGNGTYMMIKNLSNAFNKDVSIVAPSGSYFSSLNNTQKCKGLYDHQEQPSLKWAGKNPRDVQLSKH